MRDVLNITFTGIVLFPGDLISISDNNGNIIQEGWRSVRNAPNEVTIKTTADQDALSFVQSVTTDYSITNLYKIQYFGGNLVTIEALTNDTIFTVNSSDGTNIVITQLPNLPVGIDITSTSFSQSLINVCDNIKVTINTNINIDNISSPVIASNINSNTYSFDFARDTNIQIIVNTLNNVSTFTKNLSLPSKLTSSNIEIKYVANQNGATVTIFVSSGLTLQYSLDNITFQNDNFFSSQTPGSYTVYVKDQYGCVVSKTYTIDSFGSIGYSSYLLSAYAYIPPQNSFQYYENETIDNINIFPTDTNTPVCDSLTNGNMLIYSNKQLFLTSNAITTQFQSSYNTFLASLIKEDGTIINMPVVKKTTNIGREDKRDAFYYNYNGTQTGIYFTSGNTYDFNTSAITGTYILDGGIPEFGIIGQLLYLDSVLFEIKDIIYDDVIKKNSIIIDKLYTGQPTAAIVSSVYNIQNYEVYEYIANFTTLTGVFRIELAISDTIHSSWVDKLFKSDNIDIKSVQKNALKIEYYNDTNSNIYYSTGIKNILYVEFDSIKILLNDDFKNIVTDNSAILIYDTIHEGISISFSILENERAKKLAYALSHKFVLINGVGYAKFSEIKINNIENTNMNTVSVDMIKSNFSYNSEGVIEYVGQKQDIPALIQTNNKYLKL